jgi:small subunit ribosomal protein S4
VVSHGHFLVNGKKVNIPSFQVSKWDIIDVKPKSMPTLPFEVAKATFGDRPIPAWLQVVSANLRVLVHDVPVRAQIDTPVQEQLIVEFYSR